MPLHRILHLADLHLGYEHAYLGERAARRAEEAVQTLERVVDWALDGENQIAAVLIAGDLFESHQPESRLLGRVIQVLKQIPSSGRALVTVPGNHDEFSYPDSVYRQQVNTWPGTLVTCPHFERAASIEVGDSLCAIYSLAFTAGLSAKRLSLPEGLGKPEAREVRIALLHGTLDADPADRTYRIDTCSLAEAGFAYAALGHIHKPARTTCGDGFALYPGTLNGKGFDDPGTGDLTVVSFPGGRARVDTVPIPVRPIRTQTIDLSHYENQEQLIAHLERSPDPEAIVRVVFEGVCPGDWDPQALQGRLSGCFHHLEVDDRSLVVAAADLERIGQQPTVKGLFVQMMREKLASAEASGNAEESERLGLALKRGLAAFEAITQGR